jgi:hypothetical protein
MIRAPLSVAPFRYFPIQVTGIRHVRQEKGAYGAV